MAYLNKKTSSKIRKALNVIAKKYGYKLSVRMEHHSTLGVAVIEGKEIELDMLLNDASHTNRCIKGYSVKNNSNLDGDFKRFINEIDVTIKKVGEWYDHSDTMTDYFDTAFYYDITLGRWDKPYKTNNDIVKPATKTQNKTKKETATPGDQQTRVLNAIFNATPGTWTNSKGKIFNTLVLNERINKEDWKAFTTLLKVEGIGYYNFKAKAIICDEVAPTPTQKKEPTTQKETSIKGVKMPNKKDIVEPNTAKKEYKKEDTLLNSLDNDISLDLAINSRKGISFSPEQRGVTILANYKNNILAMYEHMKNRAIKNGSKEALEIFDDMFVNFRNGYKKRYIIMLERDSRVISVMISGSANYGKLGQSKKKESANKASTDVYNYYDYIKNKFDSKINGLKIIKSDDENAIYKLKAKLKELEEAQELMKAINKIVRSKKLTNEEKMGNVSKITTKLKYEDIKNGFASYALTNNNTKIKNTKARIKRLENEETRENEETQEDGYKIISDFTDKRLKIFFDSKPCEQARTLLKKHGFRWSGKNVAWQRQLTNNAIFTYRMIKKELLGIIK